MCVWFMMQELKRQISTLEDELQKTKKRYAETLRGLDRLNHSLHRQRGANSLSPAPLSSEVGGANSDSESVQSWQVGEGGHVFTGSTGSLPSIGSSVPEEADNVPPLPQQHENMSPPTINIVDSDKLTELAEYIVQQALHSALTKLTSQST